MASLSECRWTHIFLWFLIVMGTASAYYNSYSNSYSSSASTNARLARLERKMNVLINEVSRLADSNGKGSGSQTSHFEPVTLISAERIPGPNESVYNLVFTKNVEQLYYIISSHRDQIAWGSDIESTDGRSTLTFTCDSKCEEEDTVDVLFTNSSKSFEVTLELTTGSRASYQERFTVPYLEIHHSGDLVYDAGRNVSFQMSSSYGEENGFSDVSLSVDFLGAGQTRPPRGMIKQSVETQYIKTEESLVTVATSIFNISGFLQVSLTYTDPEPALVRKIKVEKSLILRPHDQTGPFSEDYVTFSNYGRHDMYHTSNSYSHCQIEQNCTLSCNAIGTITDFQVAELNVSDGSLLEPVEDTSELVFDYSRMVEWTIQPNATSEDKKFQCVAFSETGNATLTTHVRMYTPEFYIDVNRSSMHVEPHEQYDNVYLVTINCTIVGRPVNFAFIDLRFDVTGTTHYRDPGMVQLIPLSVDEMVASKTAEVGPPMYGIEYLTGARCYSSNSYPAYREIEEEINWQEATLARVP